MKYPYYEGTYHSKIHGLRIEIPKQILEVMESREKAVPEILYGYAMKYVEPYAAILPPRYYEEYKNEIERFVEKDGLSKKIYRIEVENNKMKIPEELKTLANLTEELSFIGVFTHFEIWDKKAAEKEEKVTRKLLSSK